MQDIGVALSELWEDITTYAHLPQAIAVTDIIEIGIIATLFYYMLAWIRNTRAWTLLKGVLVILVFTYFISFCPDVSSGLCFL